MDNEEFIEEALKSIPVLSTIICIINTRQQGFDDSTIFNNDLVDAYDAGQQFLKDNKN